MSASTAGAASGWERLLTLDLDLLLWVQRLERRAVTRLMRALTHLGDTSNWLLVTALLAAAGGPGPRRAALLGTAALFALAVSQPLKRLCSRPRPRLASATGSAAGRRPVVAHLDDDPDAFSFPSGHTAVAFAVAVALAGEGPGLALLTLALASGIGASRVYLGAHYPLDVAAGALLGGGAGWLARALVAAGPLAGPLTGSLAL